MMRALIIGAALLLGTASAQTGDLTELSWNWFKTLGDNVQKLRDIAEGDQLSNGVQF